MSKRKGTPSYGVPLGPAIIARSKSMRSSYARTFTGGDDSAVVDSDDDDSGDGEDEDEDEASAGEESAAPAEEEDEDDDDDDDDDEEEEEEEATVAEEPSRSPRCMRFHSRCTLGAATASGPPLPRAPPPTTPPR